MSFETDNFVLSWRQAAAAEEGDRRSHVRLTSAQDRNSPGEADSTPLRPRFAVLARCPRFTSPCVDARAGGQDTQGESLYGRRLARR